MSDIVKLLPEEPLIPPAGIKLGGLLPRDDVPCKRFPSIGAAPGFQTIPLDEWDDWIEAKTNTSIYAWNYYNQAQVGSCASESSVKIIENLREAAGQPRILFNPYATYHFVNGGVDRGSSLQANMRHLTEYGATPEELWPRSKGWQPRPPDEVIRESKKYAILEVYEANNWLEFGSGLLRDFIGYFGIPGHAEVGCEPVNRYQLRALNSWGKWGGRSPHNPDLEYGFHIVNSANIQWSYGAYLIRAVTVAGD